MVVTDVQQACELRLNANWKHGDGNSATRPTQGEHLHSVYITISFYILFCCYLN